ncbi:MAG TPA: hypothetical protein VGX23_29985 [Actinocrinis sp.]|nr:hypothetical protein [Actinocrinis sp.]
MTEVETTSEQLPWTVRYTWKVVNGLPFPKHTYETRPNETKAIDCAVSNMDRNNNRTRSHIVEAHVKAPGSDSWRRIDYTR